MWPWNGTSYSASITVAAPANAASVAPASTGLPVDDGVALRMYLKRSSDAGKGARGRLLPLDLELPRRADRLLLALAHHRDVVALAHDLDEPGNPAHRCFVDADERGAGDRRPHVARVDHPGHLHVDGPLQRAVHLRRDVVALRRLADVLHLLHGLERRHARRRIRVLAGERDVELPAADQLAVADRARTVVLPSRSETTPSLTTSAVDRRAQFLRRHVEQDAPGFSGDAAHRIAVGLQRIGSAGPTLIDGVVRAAHHAAGLVVRDVELVAHDLAERRAGALAEIGLADEERRGVVLADHDPRIELAEIGIGIRAGGLCEQLRRSREVAATTRARRCRRRASLTS